MYYLSIAAMVRFYRPNEAEQWYKYHLAIGVDHFYLVDDSSEFNLCEVFDEKHVTFLDINQSNERVNLQGRLLVELPVLLKDKTHWVALIDSDEFLFSTNDCFKNFLNAFEDKSCVELKLKQFRSDGWKHYDSNSIIPLRYTRYQDSYTIKSIANLIKCPLPFPNINIHRPFNDGVDALGNVPTKGKIGHRHYPPDSFQQPAWINHYPIRDLEQVEAKFHQGSFDFWQKNEIGMIYLLRQVWGAMPTELDMRFAMRKYHPKVTKEFLSSLSFAKKA